MSYLHDSVEFRHGDLFGPLHGHRHLLLVLQEYLLCNGGSLYAPYSLQSISNMLCGGRGGGDRVVTLAVVYEIYYTRGHKNHRSNNSYYVFLSVRLYLIY